jgi:UDP-N-acetylglucosamine transferase subunit ALG13
LPRPEFDTEIGVADIVITHGGVGSIYTALRQGHTPIVFPRRVRLGEHVNDHQVEMAQKLAEQGRVVLAEDSGTLAAQIDRFFRLQLRRRAAPTGDEDLQPIARALAEGKPAGWRWTVRAHVLVRVLAAFAPKLEQLRMDGKPDAPDGV